MINYTNKINDILDYFDFERVHRTMEALNWTWASYPYGVPPVGQLRIRARQLLEEVVETFKENHADTLVATGGFFAEIRGYTLRLTFQVTEWEEGLLREDDGDND